MRKICLFMLFCLMALFGLHAQSENDAIYIYRNDGQFNAFFDVQVDSITYSHYDADSIWHSDWQMQVVHTVDSIYRIPLEVIDSVAFAAPAPVLSSDVVRMEKGLLDYLIKVEGLDLTFDPSLPKALQPSKGDILVCTDFDHPLFVEGFVGKVYETSMSSDGFLVRCDTVNDITEVFDCIVGIEEVVYEEPGSTRGSWSSAPIPIEASLNYDTNGASGLDVSMSGTVSGRVKTTIVYNISRERQHISAMLNHDWTLGANIKLKASGKFFKSAPAQQLSPAVRFPAALPLFKFQLFGAPFVRGSADAELEVALSSPTHSYTSGVVYESGAFQGVHRSQGNSSGNLTPTFSSTLSLNGYVQGGYLFDFYLGTIECLGYVKSAVDFYIGPKLTGNYKMNLGAAASLDYYQTVKDSKVTLSLLSLDAEAYGEAAYMGESVARHTFMELSLASLLYNEWYLFPEFSDITVEPSKTDAEATLSYRPSRNVLLPLTLGIGLYDKDDELVDDHYSASEYKRDDSGFQMEHTFTSLIRYKPYTAYPLIKYAGGTIVATPSKDFRLDVVVETGEASSVTANSAVLSGHAEGLEAAEILCKLGICYATSGTPSIDNGRFVSSDRKKSGDFTVFLSDLEANTTYYYATCLVIDGEYFYGEIKSFKTPSKEFRLDVVVETGEASSVTANSAVLAGYAEGLEAAENLCELGICYATSGTLSIDNGRFVSSGRKKSGDFTVSLSDLEANTTYYYATCLAIDGEYFYGETKSFKTKGSDLCNNANHVHAVDLGLSVKWACCNVGADVPEGYGGYYAWGETEEKSNYTWESYKYYNSSTGNFDNIGSNISGTSYDVAHVKWGGSWRMPTLSEIQELCNKCSWEWTSVNGVSGQKVTGPNGNSIFLPATGYRFGTEVYFRGSDGYFWSGTLHEYFSGYAYSLRFFSDGDWYYYICIEGHTVRPVTE